MPESYAEAVRLRNALAELGVTVVLTSGSFDLIHIGHAEYLERASNYGDFLIVGVDSDERVRVRKGPTRPLVPENERMRMVAHLRGVGAVVLKPVTDFNRSLITQLQPDVLVTSEGFYSSIALEELEEIAGKVIVLPRYAEVSTSARLRDLTLKQNVIP